MVQAKGKVRVSTPHLSLVEVEDGELIRVGVPPRWSSWTGGTDPGHSGWWPHRGSGPASYPAPFTPGGWIRSLSGVRGCHAVGALAGLSLSRAGISSHLPLLPGSPGS